MSKKSIKHTVDELRIDLREGKESQQTALKIILDELNDYTKKDLKNGRSPEKVQEFLNFNAALEILSPDLAFCALDTETKIYKEACEALDLIAKTGANINDALPELARRAIKEDEHGIFLRLMIMRWAELSHKFASTILQTINAKGIKVGHGSVWYKLHEILGLNMSNIAEKVIAIETHFNNWDKLFGRGRKDCEVCSKIPEVMDESQSGETEAPSGEFAIIINGLFRLTEGIRERGQVGDTEIRGCGKCGQLYKDYSESHDLAGFHTSCEVLTKWDFEKLREELKAMARTGDDYKLFPFVDTLIQGAKKGDVESQIKIGIALFEGWGVKKNDDESLRWFRLAAKQGHAQAQQNIGVFYLKGWSVEQDNKEAIKWFRKAAEQRLAQGQYNLGYMYDEGLGVERNEEEATKWFSMAAEQGDEMAIKTMSMRTHKYRCPKCRSINVKDDGIYEFNIFKCMDCGFRQTVSIIYPETDWTNHGD